MLQCPPQKIFIKHLSGYTVTPKCCTSQIIKIKRNNNCIVVICGDIGDLLWATQTRSDCVNTPLSVRASAPGSSAASPASASTATTTEPQSEPHLINPDPSHVMEAEHDQRTLLRNEAHTG